MALAIYWLFMSQPAGLPLPRQTILALGFGSALVLYGCAVGRRRDRLQAGVFSRAAIVLHVVGFVPYSLSPFFPQLIVTLGQAIGALGIIWLGWELWSGELPAEPVTVAAQVRGLATAGLNGE